MEAAGVIHGTDPHQRSSGHLHALAVLRRGQKRGHRHCQKSGETGYLFIIHIIIAHSYLNIHSYVDQSQGTAVQKSHRSGRRLPGYLVGPGFRRLERGQRASGSYLAGRRQPGRVRRAG